MFVKTLRIALPVLAATVLLGSPVLAKEPQPSCARIRRELDAGKSQQAVAKELKTSATHVKSMQQQQQSQSKAK
jgi:hypothetical protein